jgi:hypothetical protein
LQATISDKIQWTKFGIEIAYFIDAHPTSFNPQQELRCALSVPKDERWTQKQEL